MSKYDKALADLARFRAMFGGVFELAEAIKDVGSFEQAVEESKRRLNALRVEEDHAKRALANARAAVEQETELERKRVMDELAAMEEEGRGKLKAAENAAAAKVAAASRDAEQYAAGHNATLRDLESKVAAKRQELRSYVSEIDEKRAEHATIERAVAAKQALHDQIAKALAAMKQQLGVA